jgi:hypothetical protein
MNRSFLHFNDRIVASGHLTTSPDLARELKKTTEQFITLARAASQATDEDEDGELTMADQTTIIATESSISQTKQSLSPEPIPTIENSNAYTGWGYTQVFQPESSPEQEVSYAQGDPVAAFAHAASLVHPDRSALVPWNIDRRSGSQINTETTAADFFSRAADSVVSFNSAEPTISSPLTDNNSAIMPLTEETLALFDPLKQSSMRAPYTYSFQEKTFARRLHRAAVERCFHILSEQPNNPMLHRRCLKLSLQFKTIDQLRSRFLEVLQRGTDESLENWHTPFIHLGGAGTHYPQKDEKGNIIPRPNSYYVRRTGPLTQLEDAQNPGVTMELDCDLSEFAGEWFDSHDVEGFLQEKGVRIDPQASFAEAEIISSPVQLDMTMGPNMTNANTHSPSSSDSYLTRSNSLSSQSRPRTPNIFDNLASIPDFSDLDSYLFSGQEPANIAMTQPTEDYFNRLAYDPNFDFLSTAPSPKSNSAPPPVVEKRTVTLDVTKFITGEYSP